MELSELKVKTVVNVNNGEIIGYMSDALIIMPSGNIQSIIVNVGKNTLFSRIFSSKIEILWEDVLLIGIDVILINLENAQIEKKKQHKIWVEMLLSLFRT